MKNKNNVSTTPKQKYLLPVLNKLGTISKITLKTGSASDSSMSRSI